MIAIYEGQRGQNHLGFAPNQRVANQVLDALRKRGGVYTSKATPQREPKRWASQWIEVFATHNGKRYSWGRYNDVGAQLVSQSLTQLFAYSPYVGTSRQTSLVGPGQRYASTRRSSRG